jgi:hypothetical protein
MDNNTATTITRQTLRTCILGTLYRGADDEDTMLPKTEVGNSSTGRVDYILLGTRVWQLSGSDFSREEHTG